MFLILLLEYSLNIKLWAVQVKQCRKSSAAKTDHLTSVAPATLAELASHKVFAARF
jgi:hypothetical protein